MFKNGDRVKHPKKPEWGIGEVLCKSGKVVTIWFEIVGEKSLSLDYVQPVALRLPESTSNILDARPWIKIKNISGKGKSRCKNCGQPTQFGERADSKRVDLGWCDSCFKHSQRIFEEKETGKTRYYDELRTIDGIKSRWSPK